MAKKIIYNVTKESYNILLLTDNEITEYHQEKKNTSHNVGDIYLGTIKKIVPSLNAAFVDIGYEKDAFLHYSDLSPHILSNIDFTKKSKTKPQSLSTLTPREQIEKNGKIGDVLKEQSNIILQISKEPIRSKGHRISCTLGLPGRYIILVPFNNKITVSKKIINQAERTRLHKLITSIKPKNFGVIVRTAAKGTDVATLDQDSQEIQQRWQKGIQKLSKAKTGTQLIETLHTTSSILRDLFSKDFEQIIVDDRKTYQEIKAYIHTILPEKENIVYLYQRKKNIYEYLGLDKKLESLLSPVVGIPEGGYIVIEPTEALCVVDINSGSCVSNAKEQEKIATQINTNATKVIAQILRLRDIGGIVIVDFISMLKPENQKKVFQAMQKALSSFNRKTKVLPLNKFGVMSMTIERTGPPKIIQNKEQCPTCNGKEKIQPSSNIINLLEQQLNLICQQQKLRNITIHLHPFLYAYVHDGLLSKKWRWRFKYRQWIRIKKSPDLTITNYQIRDRNNKIISSNPQLSQERQKYNRHKVKQVTKKQRS